MEQPDSGWLLLDLLRSDARTRTIPVLVCSAACDDLRSREAWLSDRHIDALHKPFDIDDLYASVRRALSQPLQVHPAIVAR
jgi:DNA-binding response OmpR family regulator